MGKLTALHTPVRAGGVRYRARQAGAATPVPAGAGADLQKTEEAVHLWFSCVAQLRDVSKAMFLSMGREVLFQTDTLFWVEQAGCSSLGFVCHMVLVI